MAVARHTGVWEILKRVYIFSYRMNTFLISNAQKDD